MKDLFLFFIGFIGIMLIAFRRGIIFYGFVFGGIMMGAIVCDQLHPGYCQTIQFIRIEQALPARLVGCRASPYIRWLLEPLPRDP